MAFTGVTISCMGGFTGGGGGRGVYPSSENLSNPSYYTVKLKGSLDVIIAFLHSESSFKTQPTKFHFCVTTRCTF
jgi:hypothetical protein